MEFTGIDTSMYELTYLLGHYFPWVRASRHSMVCCCITSWTLLKPEESESTALDNSGAWTIFSYHHQSASAAAAHYDNQLLTPRVSPPPSNSLGVDFAMWQLHPPPDWDVPSHEFQNDLFPLYPASSVCHHSHRSYLFVGSSRTVQREWGSIREEKLKKV